MDTVNMSISGQGYVHEVRRMVLSEMSYSKAKNYLVGSSLDDETVEMIMRGEMDVEDSDDGMINLVLPEENSRYVKDLNFIYRNYIVHNGQNLKAYAIVDSFGYVDDFARLPHKELTSYFLKCDDCNQTVLDRVKNYINSHIEVQDKQFNDKNIRALHYADDPENDVVVETIVNYQKCYLLCKVVDFDVPDFLNIEEKDISEVYTKLKNEPWMVDSVTRGYRHYYEWYENEMFGSINMSVKNYPKNYIEENGDWQGYDYASARDNRDEWREIIKLRVQNDPSVIKEGYIELKNDKNQVIANIPKLPFMHWVFERVGYSDLPEYKPHSSMGMKGHQLDSRNHTDWMLGAGLDLEKDYASDSEVYTKSHQLLRKIQNDILDFDVAVLSQGDNQRITGRIFVCTKENAAEVKEGNILVIPEGTVEFDEHIRRATKDGRCGIITATGSKTVHIAIVAREMGYIVFHDPNVMKKVNNWDDVTMIPEKGRYYVII